MKVGSVVRKESGKPAEAGAFKKVLEQVLQPAKVEVARVNPAARTPNTQPAAVAIQKFPRPPERRPALVGMTAMPSEKLSTARQGMNAEAARLGASRTEALVDNRERLDARLVDLICRELVIEFSAGGRSDGRSSAFQGNADASCPPTATATSSASAPAAGATHQTRAFAVVETPASRAASAVELIEKIDTFVRSQRPVLAMTLAGGLGARVEIERLGPKEVAVKVQGRRGPPSPEEVTQIREEIHAKGLRLSALSVS